MSKLFRTWIEPNYDGCGDAADYVAWWDAYQASQNEGPGLQSLVVDSSELFKAKGNYGKRVSEMTFDNEKEVMAHNEIIAR
jgi:hypothetical protein